MANFKERYTAVPVGVNTTIPLTGTSIGGFICQTSGTITITNVDGVVLLNGFPVTAGAYHPLPMFLNGSTVGGTFVTAGGASGTLLV